MNRDEIWKRMKEDSSTVYGKPILDAFLEVASSLEGRHYDELPEAKRRLLRPQVRLNMARTPEEAERAVRDGAEDFHNAAYQMGANGAKGALEWVFARRTVYKAGVATWAFSGAATRGHREIMEWIMGMGRGFWDLDNALHSAARGGQFETAKWLVSKGAGDFDAALVGAASRGNTEIAAWALENDAACCNYAICSAASNGRLEMVKWLINTGRAAQDEKDEAMYEAAVNGQVETMKWLADNASKRYRYALEGVARHGRMDAARVLLGYIKNLDEILFFCADMGFLGLAKMAVEAGAKDLDGALKRSIPYGANRTGRTKMAEWLIDSGKVDLRGALAYASSMQNRPLADYIRKKIGES